MAKRSPALDRLVAKLVSGEIPSELNVYCGTYDVLHHWPDVEVSQLLQ